MTYNKKLIMDLYPSKDEIKDFIDKVRGELYDSELIGGKTNDNKCKIKRLKKFLDFLEGIEREYYDN